MSAASRRKEAALCAALTAILAAAGGCSLGTFDHDDCSSNADCREAFGLGSVCGSDGLCSPAQPSPRCTSTFPDDLLTDHAKHRDTIVLGSLFDRTLGTHKARERSSRLAALQIDSELGLEGRPFGIVYCTIEENSQFDDRSREEAAIASAEYLVSDLGVPALIGPAGSGDTSAVFESIRGTGTLVISPSATSPALSDLDPIGVTDDAPGLLWRTAPPDSLQGQVIAQDMLSRGVASVAVIQQVGAYGEGLAQVFQKSFTAGGGAVDLLPFDDDVSRGEHTVSAGMSSAEEVLFISSATQDAIAFLDAAAANPGYETKEIFLPDSGANQDLLDDADPKLFSQVRGTRPQPLDVATDTVFANFVSSYKTEYDEDVTQFSFTANTYDAAWLVFLGSAWSQLTEGRITGVGIAKGLRHVSEGERFEFLPSKWNGAVQRFRSGSSIDVKGASGDLDYDPLTEETSAPIQVWTIGPAAGGGFEIVPAD